MDNWGSEKYARIGIMEAVAKHTVVVDAPLHDRPNWGTGSLLKIKNRLFIATCKHLISLQYPNERIRVLYKGTAPLKWGEKEKIKKGSINKLHKEIDRSYPYKVPIVDRFYSNDKYDLLLLELEPSFEPIQGAEFFELLNPKTPAIDMGVYLMGFSKELAREVRQRFALFAYFEATRIIRKKMNTKDFDPTIHFLTDFTFTDNTVDPHGLSGCGVWTRMPSGDNIWTPNLRFVGMQHGFFEKSQVLKATKSEKILELI